MKPESQGGHNNRPAFCLEDIEAQLGRCCVAGPASPRKIADAEKELGVEFPDGYRWFLGKYGAALCEGFRIAGLFEEGPDDEPPLWSNVVTYTSQLRHASHGRFPSHYLAISDDGGDYKFYLDTSCLGLTRECPVIVEGPGVDGKVVAGTFIEFLARTFDDDISF